MKFLFIILAVISVTTADVSHIFGSGLSNTYLPPQREPHHRYGPPQIHLNTNSDIPEIFFRMDHTPSVQTNIFRKPSQNYGPPISGSIQSPVEVHFIQLPSTRQPIEGINKYAPSNQYLPPQQTYQPRSVYAQPMYLTSTPINRQPISVFQSKPIYKQPAPVIQSAPIFLPTGGYQQPIYTQPIPQPIFIPQPLPVPQPLPLFLPAPIYNLPGTQTTIQYRPSNQYLPPYQHTNSILDSTSTLPRHSIPTFQPPKNEYLPPNVTGQISQPAARPVTAPSNDYISPVPQQISTIPSYTEPQAAHSFGLSGYSYRRP